MLTFTRDYNGYKSYGLNPESGELFMLALKCNNQDKFDQLMMKACDSKFKVFPFEEYMDKRNVKFDGDLLKKITTYEFKCDLMNSEQIVFSYKSLLKVNDDFKFNKIVIDLVNKTVTYHPTGHQIPLKHAKVFELNTTSQPTDKLFSLSSLVLDKPIFKL